MEEPLKITSVFMVILIAFRVGFIFSEVIWRKNETRLYDELKDFINNMERY